MRAGRGTHCGDRSRMNLWELTAAELVAGYASAKFTPRDALAEVLARIEAVNPKINAIVTLDPDGARKAADASTDRKSTRLNSSHGYISYAVFCLIKKNH